MRPSMLAATSSQTIVQQQATRPYFSVFEKLKDRFNVPLRHIQSFVEPDGYNYQSQMPEAYRLHGNTAATFSAKLTQNAFELNQWHEMESVVHTNFGTIDNPALIFTSDSSWRIVICMGPGIEDDAHSHEKIFYMVREGPINRCQVCGQCFKVVRLKDEYTEEQDYYHLMFASLTHFETAEEDLAINLTSFWGDRPQPSMQTIPATNVYIHVNSDEADRILVDPAYKLERLTEAHEKLHALHEAYKTVERQMAKQRAALPTPYSRDAYETWYKVEQSIAKFDRIFNRVEKFNARKFNDPDNHERREKRMMERKNQRWVDNYTYFFGGLTEEEQMYRDYFQTDLEEEPEEDHMEAEIDKINIASNGDFDLKNYDFIDHQLEGVAHETYDDIIEDKIFKYKYRQNVDDMPTFFRRMDRVVTRFLERSKTRDPAIHADLDALYARDEKDTSAAQFFLDNENWRETAKEVTTTHREFMVKEGVQQYKDYYESDKEEQEFFEYLDNLSNRDRIRFMECFEDFTISRADNKQFV